MSDVTYASCDIRVYPNKELFAIDMAELINCSHLGGKHRIQGCDVSLNTNDHTLSITSGRVIIWGRLGVVEGGVIQVPTISSSSSEVTCHLVAICDLSNSTNPFSIRLVTESEYNTLTSSAVSTDEEIRNFNVTNAMDFFDFGTATVEPATGYVTSWTLSDYAIASSWGTGYDIWNGIVRFYNTNRDSIANLTNTHNADIAAINNQRYNDVNTINAHLDYHWAMIQNMYNPSYADVVQSSGLVDIDFNETGIYKSNKVVQLIFRFKSNANVPGETTLFWTPDNYRPCRTTRIIVPSWFNGALKKFSIYTDGEFRANDAIPSGLTFIGSLTFIVP